MKLQRDVSERPQSLLSRPPPSRQIDQWHESRDSFQESSDRGLSQAQGLEKWGCCWGIPGQRNSACKGSEDRVWPPGELPVLAFIGTSPLRRQGALRAWKAQLCHRKVSVVCSIQLRGCLLFLLAILCLPHYLY